MSVEVKNILEEIIQLNNISDSTIFNNKSLLRKLIVMIDITISDYNKKISQLKKSYSIHTTIKKNRDSQLHNNKKLVYTESYSNLNLGILLYNASLAPIISSGKSKKYKTKYIVKSNIKAYQSFVDLISCLKGHLYGSIEMDVIKSYHFRITTFVESNPNL